MGLAAPLDRQGGGDELLLIADALIRVAVLDKKAQLIDVLAAMGAPAAVGEPPPPLLGYDARLTRLLQADRPGLRTSAAETVAGWLPGQPAPEAANEASLIRVGPDMMLAIFGTFNPMGPTLNVLGTCRLGDGQHLLVNWMRHPFSPEYRPLLVLPDLEPGTVKVALGAAFSHWNIGPAIEFAHIPPVPEALHPVTSSAFRLAALTAGNPAELWEKAHVLEMYSGRPWSRMSHTLGSPTVPPLPPNPEEAVARWWDAVTDRAQSQDTLPISRKPGTARFGSRTSSSKFSRASKRRARGR